MEMKVNRERLLGRIEEMNRIGSLPGGGNRRLALSVEDKAARDLLAKWMRAEDLEVRVDEVGNQFGLRKGASDIKAVALGSHLDTVSTGGRYDGTYGVLAALEVISVLNETKHVTQRPLALVNFTNEEGARFSPDMMGSLVVSKPHLRHEIWKASDLTGTGATVKDELIRIGYLGDMPVGSVPIEYYVELHIEQGPMLEQDNISIGVVEKVQGIYWTEYVFTGQAAHAGTTPIARRKDPGLLAARVISFARELSMKHPGQLATVGLLEFFPNAINVVPERVRMITDLRNPDNAKLKAGQQHLDDFIASEASAEKILVAREEKVRLAPVDFDPAVASQIETSAAKLGLRSRRMVSGAGHDAQMMAAVSKAAMIFVPSVNGISHNEKEHTAPEDLVNGANVLLEVALELSA
jgi:N-carbamoyl-L-amino-acid hydrolase